jgi:hypothetical protein
MMFDSCGRATTELYLRPPWEWTGNLCMRHKTWIFIPNSGTEQLYW